MVVSDSDEALPSRKRSLLQYLLILSQEISSLHPLKSVLKRDSSSIIRKVKLLSVLLEELFHGRVSCFPSSAVLCFEELYVVLKKIKTLIDDCINGSKMWVLMQHELVENTFQEVTVELSTLLDIFPAKEMNLSEDVYELVGLIAKQCSEKKGCVDPRDENLRRKVLEMLERIKRGIIPDELELREMLNRLQLHDLTTCNEEIQSLEDEFHKQTEGRSKDNVVALIGLVRYGKCVLYGGSTSRVNKRRGKLPADVTFPADFRCPISLDLMRDPVVVSTGQTYDRPSINLWIESGHSTCPKTGQALPHTDLIPNRALKSFIAMWCREQKIPFDSPKMGENSISVKTNKAAFEATKMTISFLISKLTISEAPDLANCLVHELRGLAKTDSDNRACIAEAGGLPLLLKFLASEQSNLQVNAITTILNLSILEENKTRIMETDGILKGIIEVLRSGSTWEAKGNAAATIFSLTGVHAYRKKLGRKTRVIRGLMELARQGPLNSKRDALVAILNLAGDRDTVGKLIEGGVVEMASEVMEGLCEEGVTILEVVVKKGGLAAVAAAYHVIGKLVTILRDGTDRAQESAAATLVNICRKGGADVVAELAAIPGIERVIWDLMGMGTGRGKRKAATLLRILRRWAIGIDNHDIVTSAYSIENVSSSRIVFPG